MLLGCSGLIRMPLKIAGSEMSRIDALMVAMSTPSVVLDSAIHL